MLKESQKIDKLDRLHRERARWVALTWVFGILFVLSLLGFISLGIYVSKFEPGQVTEVPQEMKQGSAPEEEAPDAETTQKVAGVSIDDDPMKGEQDAPVTIIEFSDFLCPFCAAASGFKEDLAEQLRARDPSWEAPVPKIMETYVKEGKVRLVFRDCPFHGKASLLASEAAQCAYDQDKFWEMHDLLFSRQDNFPEDEASLRDFLKDLASELDLEQETFGKCLDDRKYKDEVQGDLEAAKSYGINGTPTYFINGQKLVGAQGFNAFQKIIEEELNK